MAQRVMVKVEELNVVFGDDAAKGGEVNGSAFEWDVVRLDDGRLHVIKDNRSYEVEMLPALDGKRQIRVNGTVYETETVGRFDALLKQLGMEKGKGIRVNDLKAPMPGLVLSIAVKPGDAVRAGDRILVLEAMKMENVIKAPGDAVVKSVEVEKGQTVDKNQVMVKFG
jgi:biotin carboxyl carrier protein